MRIIKFRSNAEADHLLHKVKKMYKFAKELKECLEDKYEEEDYEDDDYDEAEYRSMNGGGETSAMRRGRYRREM